MDLVVRFEAAVGALHGRGPGQRPQFDNVQPDHDDTSHKMGDPLVEVTEESRDASQEAKGMAMEAMSSWKLEEAR